MSEAHEYLELAEWRTRVAAMYAEVRSAPDAGMEIAWHEWRAARNDLFQHHPQSPLTAEQRAEFRPLEYFAYEASWRVTAALEADAGAQGFHFQLGADGDFYMTRIGWALFSAGAFYGRLALYWIEGYGGGLFLPFRDATNGNSPLAPGSTYGGGRYLLDTIKGVDLGREGDRLILDFNYAYNPSCAYHPRWVCPLAPPENTLLFPVAAGEKRYQPSGGQSWGDL